MEINYRNREGYPDPTCHDAVTNIVKDEKMEQQHAFRPLVYICSRYDNDRDSIGNLSAFCRFVVDKGNIPLAPHLMFSHFMHTKDDEERGLTTFMDVILLGKCQEIWVFGDRITKGMQIEINKAHQRKHQPIRYFNSDFKEVDRL